jgi:5-methyltetrahydropteroyltriglutamate--homocysteine methyltransferase
MALPLLPTTLVGSYPQPEWLVHRDKLMTSGPPRVRMRDVWRFQDALLETAQDDAVRLVVADQERAGIDIVTDGEVRRESYFNRMATLLDGIDIETPGIVPSRTGKPTQVPRVVGPIRRKSPVEADATRFLRAQTSRPIKVTVPGPFTLTQLALDEHYKDPEALALDYARAINAELRDLKAAGADVVQLDEPYLQANPEAARRYGVKAINAALEGVAGDTVVHLCFGYAYVVKGKPSGYSFLGELEACAATQVSIEAAQPALDCAILKALPSKSIMLGVINLDDQRIETPAEVAARIEAALAHVPAERIVVAPDCGMKYLPRNVAFGKLQAMVEGAAIVRRKLEGCRL